MSEIYLDNSATTRPYREVIDLAGQISGSIYGNPSSAHKKGLEAARLVEQARRQVALLFNGREDEVVFTSGGTEANNLAIIGAALRNRRRGNRLITTSIEHSSVLNCFRHLEKQGFEVSYLPVDSCGLVDPDSLGDLVSDQTILASIMHINSEIGSIQPLEACGRAIKESNPQTLYHIDAVQSFARLPLAAGQWRADMISCSAHKIHGLKGAGCLWVRKGSKLIPLLHGGGQERGLRAGTENVAAIAAFGLAAELSAKKMPVNSKFLRKLKTLLYESLKGEGVEFSVNGPVPEEGAPHIINISFPGAKAEVLLRMLEDKEIFVSAGSACHARQPARSHVLEAVGLSDDLIDSALRFSFSFFNRETEVKAAAQRTAEAVKELTSMGSQGPSYQKD